jgi:hypothetical protein
VESIQNDDRGSGYFDENRPNDHKPSHNIVLPVDEWHPLPIVNGLISQG